MKSINTLKLMIDFFFYGQVLAMGAFMVFSAYRGNFNIGGCGFENLNATVLIFMLFTILRIGSFFFAIYHIKELVSSFMKNNLFTNDTSGHMKFIGYGFILFSVAESFAESLHATINHTGDTWWSANFMGFNSGWFQFTLGLLFIFLDKVLRDAKELKQENDLTI